MNIVVRRTNPGKGKILLFADVFVGGCILLKGLKLVVGTNGVFLGMPSQKGKDEEWYDTLKIEDKVWEKGVDIKDQKDNTLGKELKAAILSALEQHADPVAANGPTLDEDGLPF